MRNERQPEPTNANGVAWLVHQYSRLHPGCADILTQVRAADKTHESDGAGNDGQSGGSGGTPRDSMEDKKAAKRKQAQQKALAAMEKQQAAFAAFAAEMVSIYPFGTLSFCI